MGLELRSRIFHLTLSALFIALMVRMVAAEFYLLPENQSGGPFQGLALVNKLAYGLQAPFPILFGRNVQIFGWSEPKSGDWILFESHGEVLVGQILTESGKPLPSEHAYQLKRQKVPRKHLVVSNPLKRHPILIATHQVSGRIVSSATADLSSWWHETKSFAERVAQRLR